MNKNNWVVLFGIAANAILSAYWFFKDDYKSALVLAVISIFLFAYLWYDLIKKKNN